MNDKIQLLIHGFLEKCSENWDIKYDLIINKFNPVDIKSTYTYNVKRGDINVTWYVIENDNWKLTLNDQEDYYSYFSKLSGYRLLFGKTLKDDPEWCELGPEIMDLEISVNGCPTINGHNCKFCYKNNTNKTPYNMFFDTFKSIINKMPKNLQQIAFGITGVKTNPDFPKMIQYCKDNGIIPNFTTNGVDLDDDFIKEHCCKCGAIAVSCYEGAKEICYDTIKRIHTILPEMHINSHIVLSKGTFNHVMDVLKDISEGKVAGLRSLVFLRIKPVGRAACMDCGVTGEMYTKIIRFCTEHDISYGFDSCSAKSVISVLKNLGKDNLCNNCESCESSRFSSYINVKGEYWNCSFCENNQNIMKPIDVLKCNSFDEVWHNKELDIIRTKSMKCCSSCPWYNLD